MKHKEIIEKIQAMPARSAWARGVKQYAIELVEDAESLDPQSLLKGARDWREYSYGGSALAYDEDIAARLCSPAELKRAKNGAKKPNPMENWLEVQTRALRHAAYLVSSAVKSA